MSETANKEKAGGRRTVGRVVSNKGEPISGATVHAVRNAEDPVASGEAQSAEDGTFALGGLDTKRYFLRASKFGWLPETLKWMVTAPAKGWKTLGDLVAAAKAKTGALNFGSAGLGSASHIAVERLRARPETTLCIACKSEQEEEERKQKNL